MIMVLGLIVSDIHDLLGYTLTQKTQPDTSSMLNRPTIILNVNVVYTHLPFSIIVLIYISALGT